MNYAYSQQAVAYRICGVETWAQLGNLRDWFEWSVCV